MSEWISVKDSVPDDTTYPGRVLVYLVTQPGWGVISMAYWIPEDNGIDEFHLKHPGYWKMENRQESVPFDITHWMPLPDPPRSAE